DLYFEFHQQYREFVAGVRENVSAIAGHSNRTEGADCVEPTVEHFDDVGCTKIVGGEITLIDADRFSCETVGIEKRSVVVRQSVALYTSKRRLHHAQE